MKKINIIKNRDTLKHKINMNQYRRINTKITILLIKVVASRVLCESHKFMRMAIRGIIESSGEGVILRKHSSLYLPGRNFSLIKLKVFQSSLSFSLSPLSPCLSLAPLLPPSCLIVLQASQGDQEGLVVGVEQNGTVLLKLYAF